MTNILLEPVEYKCETTPNGVWRRFVSPNGMAFHEYKSSRTLLGLPLLHYTNGICPETGRRVTARGFVAIGRRAIGVIAIGQLAIGFVAVGQAAFGALFALGQAAIAAAAIGQLALGATALGQFAIGVVAIGQIAAGYWAWGISAAFDYAHLGAWDWWKINLSRMNR